ncbi:MAG: acyl-CoA synthetase [Magnetovibrio sp.]|nr:acyl-CoA synthetase [Magnetovibrio sp.]
MVLSVQDHVTNDVFAHGAKNMAVRLQALGLNNKPKVILVQNRTDFMVALYGSLLAGCDVLLPNDDTPHTLQHLAQDYSGLSYLCNSDGIKAHKNNTDFVLIPNLQDLICKPSPISPFVNFADLTATITVFTSGSTGKPVGHKKSVSSFILGADHWAQRLNIGNKPAHIVATVPPQHMYGLESSIMLPLAHENISVLDTCPFYPADIRQALDLVSENRLLITTPFHLSILLKSGEDLPPLKAIVCATAPLTQDLAVQAENRWNAPVVEIFGSSETGMLATRRTAHKKAFSLRSDLTLENKQKQNFITGETLDQPVLIADVLTPTHDGFVFEGRGDDLISIAGKRMSLSGLNAILNMADDVKDGIFHMQDNLTTDQCERLVALVVAPVGSAQSIKDFLRTKIDGIFLPRKIIFLSELPRNSSGKITKRSLDDTLAQLKRSQTVLS